MTTAITLDFYDDDNEKVATHNVVRVKTKLLKTAIRLSNDTSSANEMSEEQADALFDFIVELFGNKFTRAELEEQTDLFECFAVVGNVFARANGMAVQAAKTNPTIAPSRKRK